MWVPFQIFPRRFHDCHHLFLSKISKTQILNDLKFFNQSLNYFHVHILRPLYCYIYHMFAFIYRGYHPWNKFFIHHWYDTMAYKAILLK